MGTKWQYSSCVETLHKIEYIIISRTIFKLKISPNNTVISNHYCTSLAITIRPITQVWLTFVRVKCPFSEAIVTPSIIQFWITIWNLCSYLDRFHLPMQALQMRSYAAVDADWTLIGSSFDLLMPFAVALIAVCQIHLGTWSKLYLSLSLKTQSRVFQPSVTSRSLRGIREK
jgi:hypothetical protein